MSDRLARQNGKDNKLGLRRTNCQKGYKVEHGVGGGKIQAGIAGTGKKTKSIQPTKRFDEEEQHKPFQNPTT